MSGTTFSMTLPDEIRWDIFFIKFWEWDGLEHSKQCRRKRRIDTNDSFGSRKFARHFFIKEERVNKLQNLNYIDKQQS